jgi:nondiscriminating glutamyl-tRNA synthetase
MNVDETLPREQPLPNVCSADDVRQLLLDLGWVSGAFTPGQTAWCERAAALLGTQVADRSGLPALLELISRYDAREILGAVEAHVVMSRYAARDVVRQLALLLLEDGPLTTERFREIVASLKETLDSRGRDLFHPLRLALAGRAGEGDLDRVILLLDEAAAAGFAMPVKTARERILEFCATLD